MIFIILVAAIIFVFGAAVGSFISAAAYRMHRQETMFSRSHCPRCGRTLSFFDLLPILSFLCLRGKCRRCKSSIDLEYFLTEAVSGSIFVFSFFYRWINSGDGESFSWIILRDWTFLSGLAFLFIYDFKYQTLPDKVTLPLIVAMAVINFFLKENFVNILFGIVIGAGFFLTQYLISRGKWVGDGDIRMGALLGAALGWPNIALAIFLAYIIGASVSVCLLFTKKKQMKSRHTLTRQ